MSLETLLEAARYVELQEAQRLQQQQQQHQQQQSVTRGEEEPAGFLSTSVTAPSSPPRPPAVHNHPPPPPPPPPPSKPSHHPHHHHHHHHHHQQQHHVSNGGSTSPAVTTAASLVVDDSKDFVKKAAGTREVHNKLEKNRRAHLKECFELLKKQLPASQDEKKSSNLSILHSALRYIQSLRRKEREFEHEMERLAREKIAAQQRLAVLKKELSAQWDHIDFNTLLPDSAQVLDDPRNRDHISHTTSTATGTSSNEENPNRCDMFGLKLGDTTQQIPERTGVIQRLTYSEREEPMSDGAEEPLSKCGVIYSSSSSLSSAATACSPPQLPPPPPPPPPPPAEVHGHGGEGPKTAVTTTGSSSVATSASTPAPTATLAQHHVQLPVTAHQMVGTPGLAATLVSPTIQLLTPSSIRMLPTGDAQPLALTVHPPHLPSTTVSSHPRLRGGNGSTSESSDTRTTAAITLPTLHLTNKMVAGSVALTAEAARLPGGAELNILPANGLRGNKNHPITLTGGLTIPNGGVLSHAGVTLTTKSIAHTPGSDGSSSGSTVLTSAIHGAGTIPTHLASAGITHVVTPLGSHTGLTPLVTPVTVVSQGSQVAHILATPQQLGGKMMTTTPLLKSVGPMPLMNTQYLSAATLVKPVVVVSTPSAIPPPHTHAST